MIRSQPLLLIRAVLAGLLAWVSVAAWQGFLAEPTSLLTPALLGGTLVVATAALTRLAGWRWYATLSLQLVLGIAYLNHHVTGIGPLAGWLPTRRAVRTLAGEVVDGAITINTVGAPIGPDHPEAVAYLLLVALLVIVLVDTLVCGFDRVALAGLPLLGVVMVPIGVLSHRLPWPVLVTAILLYLLLLVIDESISHVQAPRPQPGQQPVGAAPPDRYGVVMRSAALLGLGTLAVAFAAPLVIRTDRPLLRLPGGTGGSGGDRVTVSLHQPQLSMRRNLIAKDHIPLVEISTTERDPAYLRLSVLEELGADAWRVGARLLPPENRAEGAAPFPPGLSSQVPQATTDWTITVKSSFATRWLPLPYPFRWLSITDGDVTDWRYDDRTLDVTILTDDTDSAAGLRYRVEGVVPTFDADQLRQSPDPPSTIAGPMTEVPDALPAVVVETAEKVTATAATPFDRAVALQEWFRTGGGFTYSLEPDDATGIDAIARFITTDRFGYCEQFAAAMATMARALGIPARVAMGFLRPTGRNGDRFVYTSDDLHAWPELYFEGAGWVRFEPTPAQRTDQAPQWTRNTADRTTPSATPTPTPTASPSPTPSRTPTPLAGDNTSSRTPDRPTTITHLRKAAPWVAGGLVLALTTATPHLVRDRQRRRRLAGQIAPAADRTATADLIWAELRATATDLGRPVPTGRSVRDDAAHLATLTPDNTRDLTRLAEKVETARYGPELPFDPADQARMVALAESWRAAAMAASGRSARFRALWLPASLLDRSDRSVPANPDADRLTPQR